MAGRTMCAVLRSILVYQSMAGAMRLSAAGTAADPALAAATLALSFKSVFVVGAMAIGLLLGARIADLTSRRHRMSDG